MSKAICSVKTPGCTYLGINATEKISGILEKENAKKVIVLTDRGVYDTGLCTRVLEQLNGAAYHLYTDIKREPSYLDVEDVVQTIEDLQCDMIVAVGGGSVMDTAKLCSVLKNAPYSIKDLLRDPALAHKQIKTVFLPTTCGTGSEATCNAIVAIPEESVKKGIVNDEMIPDYAILAPEMIRHLPPATPCSKELGIDITTTKPRGYYAPAGTSQEVLDLLADAIEEVTKTEEFATLVEGYGWEINFVRGSEMQPKIEAWAEELAPVFQEILNAN